MKLTAQLKLLPTFEQADALRRTLEAANAACDYISRIAWDTKTFGKFALQKVCYATVRETFGLAAQMTIRALGKVGDADKLATNGWRTFRPHGAISYDDRILSFALPDASVSIWTLDGRQSIPFVCGARQRQVLATQHGETDLADIRGEWFLFAVCAVEEPTPTAVEGILGIDLGVTNIAVASDGERYSGTGIQHIRYRQRSRRNKLQRKRTHGSRRRVKNVAGPERRFATWTNHNRSKQIVVTAKRTKRARALEDLPHIRSRVRARRSQRTTLHSWAFLPLRLFIVSKAALAGVPVHVVDPRNTARTCPTCGCIDKANRTTPASFVCTSCGFAGHADVIAAGTSARRAAVSPPYYPEASQPRRARVKPKPLRLG